MGGRRVVVRWRFNPAASSVTRRRLAFVYDAPSPRLRAVWEWTARAEHGPIEHQIRIQNLDGRVVWLPLQDSFRFDWQIAQRAALKQVYVEKGADKPSSVGTHEITLGQAYQWQGTSSTY
ncbi:MAG TPA: hypothetical protein VLC12_09065, partial [Terriglobales bacterium]|nr:hypothetical protein [Terriglobales bacterium]